MIKSKKKCGNTVDDEEVSNAIQEIGNDQNQSSTEFICNYCSRSFTRKYNIINHIQNFHMNTTFCCEICGKHLVSSIGLQLHMARGHNRFKQPNPECDICGKIFTRKANIIPHFATVHEIGAVPSLACNVCGRSFTMERNLKRHLLKLHNPHFENPICDECKMVFRVKEALISHIQSSHNISAKDISRCHLCERVYCAEKNLKRHVEVYHGEKYENEQKFKCNYCPKEYTTNHSLKRHIRTLHSDGQILTPYCHDSLKCDCGKTFEEEPLLRKHIKDDHPFDVFYTYCKNFLLRSNNDEKVAIVANIDEKCDKVNTYEKSFENFESLYPPKNYMKSKHNTNFASETCNVCFTKFFSKDALARHKKRCVPPDNVNRCNHCEKLFTAKQSLQFHIKVFHPQHIPMGYSSPDSHKEDTNELKCEYCDKVFKLKQNVKKHIEYIHFGIQRYKCLECESMFTERRNLRKHIRLKHKNSSNFPQCHFCRRRFESAKACKDHLQVSHSYNTKSLACEICSRWFETNDSLKKHMKNDHTEENDLFKCYNCTLLFRGFETFEEHKMKCHENAQNAQRSIPRCVICMKDFSCLKTLLRHIKQFHKDFNAKELAEFGYRKQYVVDCKNCLQRFTEDDIYDVYLDNKDVSDAIVFKCDDCGMIYNVLEFGVQRLRINRNGKRKRISHDVDKIQERLQDNEMEVVCTDVKSDNSDVEIVDENLK